MIFNIVILVAVAAVIVIVVGHALAVYRSATGSVWDRILASARDSATYLWGKIIAIAGMLLVWSDYAAQFFNLPDVQTFIQQHLTPTNVGIAMTVIAVVTIAARLRTLGSA